MVGNALPLFRSKIDFAEPQDFFGKVDSRSIQLRFQFIQPRGLNFFAHFSAFVILFEGLLDFLPVIDEIQNERVFLERMNAIEP